MHKPLVCEKDQTIISNHKTQQMETMALSEKDTNDKPTKLRIIKNLVVITFSFLMLFTGFDGLMALQSTMNGEEGMGTQCQALAFVFFCTSALLLPKYVIQKTGCKCCMVLSQFFFIPWIAANFYPHWGTLAPTSMLAGIAAATLWSSKCTYFNKASLLYCSIKQTKRRDKARAFSESMKSNNGKEPLSLQNSLSLVDSSESKLKNDSQISLIDSNHVNYKTLNSTVTDNDKLEKETSFTHGIPAENSLEKYMKSTEEKREIMKSITDHESINALFFGCNTLVFKSAEIWSNLISYHVLRIGENEGGTNITDCSCGADFCDAESQCMSDNIGGISDDNRYLLSGICIALAVMAIIIMVLFLDPIEESREPVTLSLEMCMATYTHCKRKEQLILIPITFLLGLTQGFYTADFTKAYIGCAWGTYHIGLVNSVYGAWCAVSSYISGWLVKHIGRIPIMLLVFATAMGTSTLLLTWTPNTSQTYMFYIIASLWGVYTGTMWTQIPAFYGVLFKEDEEAAFASLYVWESLGSFIALMYSNYLCTYVKLYILMFAACAGFIGYLITERNFAVKKNEICNQ